MARLFFTHSALRDLDAMRQWLSQPGAGDRAARKRREIVSALKEIGEAPHRWPDSLEHPGVKARHVHGYAICYTQIEERDEVVILRIFGPRQRRAL